MTYKQVILVVLDGVGARPFGVESPFSMARLPTFREFEHYYPFTTVRASGVAVGLPWGEEGNSEVGHLTMGAGRVFYHHLPRIITAIQDGSFFENEAFLKAAHHVENIASTLHLMGLFSSGSVHAYVDHLYALLELAERKGIERVMVHVFTDGRDAPPDEAAKFIEQLSLRISKKYTHAAIASVIGRHFAMDRDGNWGKTEICYRLLTEGVGNAYTNPVSYIQDMYQKGVTDEFIEPGYLADVDGAPRGRIQAGDAVVYYDFREDSVRQLTSAFLSDSFEHFTRKKIENMIFVTMTEYSKEFFAEVAFQPIEISWPLARVVSEAGKTQLHVAETEKYAHVTYFFNGGREEAYKGEERVLVPTPSEKSPKDNPEMAASAITEAVIAGLKSHSFILANYANGDMVGHTGDFDATVRALEVIDGELKKIQEAADAHNAVLIITADHGNAEEKRYAVSGEPRTKHTTNAVPFFVVAREFRRESPRGEEEVQAAYKEIGGVLVDVAPTILELMNLEKPGEMTGVNILRNIISRSSS